MGIYQLTRPLITIALVFGMFASAWAQTLHGVTDSLTGGGSITPPVCNGVIDLSVGCALPMLGGAP